MLAPQRPGPRFAEVDAIFDACVAQARERLDADTVDAWLDLAFWLGRLGRGAEPQRQWLLHGAALLARLGPGLLAPLREALAALQKTPDGRAIGALLAVLPALRLFTVADATGWLAQVLALQRGSSVAIHHRAIDPSAALPVFLAESPGLLARVPVAGLGRWLDAGLRLHGHHPDRLAEFLRRESPDSRALFNRERPGLALADAERRLMLTLRALWALDEPILPLPEPTTDGEAAAALPCLEADGLHLPERLAARAGVGALQRYRLMAAHLAGHRRWSHSLVADNWSPMQRLAVETVEDARIDALLLRRFPGLGAAMRALHPTPPADPDDAADSQRRVSTLRLRLTRLSRALLTSESGDDLERECVARFTESLSRGESSTREMATLALAWVARSRRPSDQFAEVIFEGTQVDWRDDNRHLWRFIEAGDEEDTLGDQPPRPAEAEPDELPPRLYPEWDAAALAYRPDWVKVYDRLQPAGRAADIDALLARHHDTERDLKRLLDALKPQDRVRLHHQEEGSELDLDRAIAALGDLRAGLLPDTRVQMSHRTDGRDIAVLLLMDLSASVNDRVKDPVPAGEGGGEPGAESGETVLSLSRAAVALLAGAIATLGDQLAIVGFHSDTRQRVDLLHVKGFSEAWDEAPKARLAGVQGAFSTRMGAALRHAGELLSGRRADRRLLLVLTDGRPSDVDVADPEHLVADAAQAVHELDAQGLYTHCISLDAQADAYVGRIFGARCSVIDRVAQLPRRLPEIFLGLTR
ncbi:hypothetical protein [Sphaerotilus microaerophilus]|nr:hypothetical protein [Sphaerotilus sp. FB-5]